MFVLPIFCDWLREKISIFGEIPTELTGYEKGAVTFTRMTAYYVRVDNGRHVKPLKTLLEKEGVFNHKLKITKLGPNNYAIPVLLDDNKTGEVESFKRLLIKVFPDIKVCIEKSEEVNGHEKTIGTSLAVAMRGLFTSLGVGDEVLVSQLLVDLPRRYSIYPPLLLLPVNTLDSEVWNKFLANLSLPQRNQIFRLILEFYSTNTNALTHLAINKPIPESDNVIRSPTQLTTLYGDFNNFWCHVVQNGIYQTWMPTYTMFSRGNIKEKARILTSYEDIDHNHDVVDMYAGIGYFTLSYLKRGARRLYCWEINPYSVEGLSRGVTKNNFGNVYIVKKNEKVDLKQVNGARCVIFVESNEYCLERFRELKLQATSSVRFDLSISHVNLGLLPTSKPSWPYSCQLLDLYGAETTWIHVHENIGILDLDNFLQNASAKLQGLSEEKRVEPIWLEKVKTFAPDVYHVVGDFKLVSL